ncbi:MAG: PilN domain-containing protein [Gammaproteobacteria bacterium]|jgi:type IV pilus assembly protein PilN
MTRINLLPWRDLLRKEREREFFTLAGGAAFFMVLVIVYVHFHMSGVIETQNQRNTYLQQQIKLVENKIKDIRELEKQKSQLLARMKVIEELQGQRPQMVHLFDELVKAMPDGVYLTSVKQTGSSVELQGVAQSNARVSALMRNIDASQWLGDPKLNVIQALGGNKGKNKGAKKGVTNVQKGSTFILNLKQKTTKGDDADTGATNTPKAAAAKRRPKKAATRAKRGKAGKKS